VPPRLAQKKILSAEGLCAAERSTNLRTHPFAKLEKQEPAAAKEWGTHFLEEDTKAGSWVASAF